MARKWDGRANLIKVQPANKSFPMHTTSFWLSLVALFFSAAAARAGDPPKRKYTNTVRLSTAHLKATHDDVE
jgi:hypothetical protein